MSRRLQRPTLAVDHSLGLLHTLTVPEEGWPHLPCGTPYSLAEGSPGPMDEVDTGTRQLATLVQQALHVTGTAAPKEMPQTDSGRPWGGQGTVSAPTQH